MLCGNSTAHRKSRCVAACGSKMPDPCVNTVCRSTRLLPHQQFVRGTFAKAKLNQNRSRVMAYRRSPRPCVNRTDSAASRKVHSALNEARHGNQCSPLSRRNRPQPNASPKQLPTPHHLPCSSAAPSVRLFFWQMAGGGISSKRRDRQFSPTSYRKELP